MRAETYLEVNRGIILRLVRVSTRRMNGMMERTLW